MPRFYFDVCDDKRNDRDHEGQELHDLAAAAVEAKRILPSIAREDIPQDGERISFSLVVRDESDYPVYTATLSFTGVFTKREIIAQTTV